MTPGLYRNTASLAQKKLLQLSLLAALSLLLSCGGGGGASVGGSGAAVDCAANCAADSLSAAEVETILAQAVLEAQSRGARATIAVSDRVGNILGVYSMTGAAPTFRIDSQRGASGGLENVDVLPSSFAAISKALTGAYLSSAGNAFSSRTASQIVQENFNPREANQPSGPLFGVQFSQFSCSDLMRRETDAMLGPKRSPLGLSADPGGLALYKNGRVVGGVGVIADSLYGLDLNVVDIDADTDELIAIAGARGFFAPTQVQANRITADGRSLRYTDRSDINTGALNTPALSTLAGTLTAVPGYFSLPVRAGAAFGLPSSGIRKDTGTFAALNGYILVDSGNNNAYPPRAGTDGFLSAIETQQLLQSALEVANRTRAQIRQPAGQAAQVTISVVDSVGEVLGVVRSPDAPVFGTDVSLQKARSAAFFSHPGAAASLASLPDAVYLSPMATSPIAPYVTRLRAFLGRPAALSDGLAFSNRSIGNLARPFFPDGIAATAPGPLSKPFAEWSVFNTGLQLDLSLNAVTNAALGDLAVGCTGLAGLRNGLQIFPGGFAVYRLSPTGNQLIGALGISGDGVDQDDMIAFLGIRNAAVLLGTSLGHPPPAERADSLGLAGGQLRYVQCPQAPFNNSTEQNVCAGL
ncbi:MAG: heme-binding protein [Burkholderiaceae bacterium]